MENALNSEHARIEFRARAHWFQNTHALNTEHARSDEGQILYVMTKAESSTYACRPRAEHLVGSRITHSGSNLVWANRFKQSAAKNSLRRKNRTPAQLRTPGFEALTRHQPGSPKHFLPLFYALNDLVKSVLQSLENLKITAELELYVS